MQFFQALIGWIEYPESDETIEEIRIANTKLLSTKKYITASIQIIACQAHDHFEPISTILQWIAKSPIFRISHARPFLI